MLCKHNKICILVISSWTRLRHRLSLSSPAGNIKAITLLRTRNPIILPFSVLKSFKQLISGHQRTQLVTEELISLHFICAHECILFKAPFVYCATLHKINTVKRNKHKYTMLCSRPRATQDRTAFSFQVLHVAVFSIYLIEKHCNRRRVYLKFTVCDLHNYMCWTHSCQLHTDFLFITVNFHWQMPPVWSIYKPLFIV